MKLCALILMGALAAVSSVARPVAAAPTGHAPGIVAAARAVHTGVHRPERAGHRRHIRRGLHGSSAVASIARTSAAPQPAAPAAPVRRPARTHATLPHGGAKIRRAPSRVGNPYVLRQASPSLALATSTAPLDATRNDTVTDPTRGILKGRSPPRGDPPCATSLLASARDLPPPRAPRTILDTPSVLASRPHVAAAFARAPIRIRRPSSFTRFTPDRALEGRPVGHVTPSRRCLT